MYLDKSICKKARLARDPRFDGRFFTGVHTTGIYCRSVCPAPAPLEENVTYFPSAAAAAEAGLRPCLRCRPEAAPGSPAWTGVEATVARAMKLIGSGVMDEGSVEDLADRLGVGSRHLRRLFKEHLGAGPIAVNNTRRLLFARKLIHETNLTFAQIGLAAGFGSIRRFNGAFKKYYGHAPGQLRRKKIKEGEGLRLRLAFRPPYDWEGVLDFLRLRALPGIEQVDEKSYTRTIESNGVRGHMRVTCPKPHNALQLELHLPDLSSLLPVVTRAKRLFDLDADITAINEQFSKDPALGPLIQKRPGLRVPGAWDDFELSVRAILGQQVSVKAAKCLAGRLVEQFGEKEEGMSQPNCFFPKPEALAEADLTTIGIPRTRAETLSRLARALVDGDIDFCEEQSLESFVKRMTAIKGIGDWTAQYIAMRALNQPDAFPAADLILLKAVTPGTTMKPNALRERSQVWRPWRSYAVLHLWAGYNERALEGE